MGDDTKYHHCVEPSRMVTYRITLERIGPYLDYEVIHYDAIHEIKLSIVALWTTRLCRCCCAHIPWSSTAPA